MSAVSARGSLRLEGQWFRALVGGFGLGALPDPEDSGELGSER